MLTRDEFATRGAAWATTTWPPGLGPPPSVASGNPYGVPSAGGISSWKVTSWSSFGASSGIQLKLKFFRATATPDEYQAVAHADTQTVHAARTYRERLADEPHGAGR